MEHHTGGTLVQRRLVLDARVVVGADREIEREVVEPGRAVVRNVDRDPQVRVPVARAPRRLPKQADRDVRGLGRRGRTGPDGEREDGDRDQRADGAFHPRILAARPQPLVSRTTSETPYTTETASRKTPTITLRVRSWVPRAIPAPMRAPGTTPITSTRKMVQSMCPRAACTIVPGTATIAISTSDVPSARFNGI